MSESAQRCIAPLQEDKGSHLLQKSLRTVLALEAALVFSCRSRSSDYISIHLCITKQP
jgi:hypothetical protein